jgi:Sulfotransferase domain
MPRPTFLILGTSKAGSTSLYHYLALHPDVFMSEPKEPPFFQVEYERGIEYYWYSYFRKYAGQKQIGEASTKNLQLPFVAPRIGDMLPDARLFVLCRNPVDRAISAYWDSYSHGVESLGFEAAMEKNLRRLETGPRFEDETEGALYARVASQGHKALQSTYGFYIEPGYYAEHIERFRALFGQDRMMIIFFEDLTRDMPGVWAEVQRFLGLDPRPLDDAKAQNRAMSRTGAMLCSTVAKLPGVNRIPPAWRTEVRRRIAERFGAKKLTISDATKRMLLEHFRPHNERLAELTGRNLDHWNQLVH